MKIGSRLSRFLADPPQAQRQDDEHEKADSGRRTYPEAAVRNLNGDKNPKPYCDREYRQRYRSGA